MMNPKLNKLCIVLVIICIYLTLWGEIGHAQEQPPADPPKQLEVNKDQQIQDLLEIVAMQQQRDALKERLESLNQDINEAITKYVNTYQQQPRIPAEGGNQ